MSNLAELDLGRSYRFEVPVADLFFRRLPATVTMATAALVVTLVIAVPLGVYSAYKRSGPLDLAARSIAGLGQAVPAFWLGLLAILFFAVRLDWLPSGGTGGVRVPGAARAGAGVRADGAPDAAPALQRDRGAEQ